MPDHLEIERKYLLSGLPEMPPGIRYDRLRQGYIQADLTNDASPFREGRLRERVDEQGDRQWTHTIKTGVGLVRTEVETFIDAEAFAIGWELTAGARLSKRRYLVPEGNLTWEIDAFEDRELFLAEVELSSPDEAVAIPPWLEPVLVREVTDESAYVNVNLAC